MIFNRLFWSAAAILTAALSASAALPATTGDWPMWRGDAARSGVTAVALPSGLHLRWVRALEPAAPAWPASQPKIRMDEVYEPVAAGGRLFIASMSSDRVTAYDASTGAELWRFYADGPFRFAPLVWRDNVYAVSDDGLLYCLDAATGTRRWSVRGGPDGRLLLGNDRLISMWPARGAPVLVEEGGSATLYFTAGIWPFMGVFIKAVDAETGALCWENSGSGSTYILQQHSSPAFAGVAPQGYLAAADDTLLVPGGRTPPALYDRRTGAFRYFHADDRVFGKDAGGFDVGLAGGLFQNRGCLYTLTNGAPVINLNDRKKWPGLSAAILGDAVYRLTETGLEVSSLPPGRTEETVKDKAGKEKTVVRYSLPSSQSRTLSPQPIKTIHFRAGDRLYGSGADGLVGAIDLAASATGLAWSAHVTGEVGSMAPGNGRLFVSTRDGSVFCFGDKPEGEPLRHEAARARAAGPPASLPVALVWGLGEDAATRLHALSDRYQVIAADPDPARVAALRRRLDDAGLYGRRIHLLVGDPATLPYPSYLAERIEFDGYPLSGTGAVARVLACLRPYGGKAMASGEAGAALAAAASALPEARAALRQTPGSVALVREGPLPGAGSWTHQYGDAANTVVAADDRVKSPLGLLWFGGPPNDDILPRHGHGPSPQVVGGRLFIEGPDALRAVDVYTGRLLWQKPFKGLGRYYDNTNHQPGAGEIGANIVSQEDGLYLVWNGTCLRLDPATGETLNTFTLPPREDGAAPNWGFVSVYRDLLIGTSGPLTLQDPGKKAPPVVTRNAPYGAQSEALVVMDRHSGKVLWQRQAAQAFRHNAIACGGGLLFCIDGLSKANLDLLRRRGEEPAQPARLLALDARTGEVRWQADTGVFGTWLGYSEAHDVLLESGSPARDRARDEAKAVMAAFRGTDGTRLWRETFSYAGTPILHGRVIYTEGAAVDLLTGDRLRREHPLTGQAAEWTFTRQYGCNTPIAGRHMLLFRSAAAGFYDLAADGGTANWGGFKSGCTANLIPADGVLNAPDYTRTCTCSYQNQCSLALVPMAGVEAWTFQSTDTLNGPLRRAGFNFGAPGDWTAPDGTLWLEHPSVGGKGPAIPVEVQGLVSYYRLHAARVAGPLAPVAASGLEGACTIRIGLEPAGEPRSYTVRLCFAEPAERAGPPRLFHVRLQGERVLTNLNVAAEAGGAGRSWIREFPGVAATSNLVVTLEPAEGSGAPPMLAGVALARERTLRARLAWPEGAPDNGRIPARLDISNETDRAVTAEVTASLGAEPLARGSLAIPPGMVSSLPVAVPAVAVNAGRTLALGYHFGNKAGREREELALQARVPLAVDVSGAAPDKAFVLIRNRRMDAALAGRLRASMDGKTVLEQPFDLAAGGTTNWTCQAPPALAGLQAEMVVTVEWARNGPSAPGRFVAGLDLREGAKPADEGAEAD